jgi:hypothetical protein
LIAPDKALVRAAVAGVFAAIRSQCLLVLMGTSFALLKKFQAIVYQAFPPIRSKVAQV